MVRSRRHSERAPARSRRASTRTASDGGALSSAETSAGATRTEWPSSASAGQHLGGGRHRVGEQQQGGHRGLPPRPARARGRRGRGAVASWTFAQSTPCRCTDGARDRRARPPAHRRRRGAGGRPAAGAGRHLRGARARLLRLLGQAGRAPDRRGAGPARVGPGVRRPRARALDRPHHARRPRGARRRRSGGRGARRSASPRVVTCGWSMGGATVIRHAALRGHRRSPATASAGRRTRSSPSARRRAGSCATPRSMRRLHRVVETRSGRLFARRVLRTRISADGWDPLPASAARVRRRRRAAARCWSCTATSDGYFPVAHAHALVDAAERAGRAVARAGLRPRRDRRVPRPVARLGAHLPVLLERA